MAEAPPPPPPPTNAVERAVVAKGRPSSAPSASSTSTSSSSSKAPAPLILVHPPPAAATVAALAFARHATFLHRHLLGRLRASPRYAGVVLLGLEDDPARMLPGEEGAEEAEGRGDVVLLDGFSGPAAMGLLAPAAPPPPSSSSSSPSSELDFTSPQALAATVQQAVASAVDGGGRPQADEAGLGDGEWRALGIDSLNMLAHRLGSAEGALRAIQALLTPSSSSSSSSPPVQPQLAPILAVLHPEGVLEPDPARRVPAAVWEDLATTNIYVHPGEGGRGRCLVVRRSASGRVQEDWEPYRIVGEYHAGGGHGIGLRVVLGAAAAAAATDEGAAKQQQEDDQQKQKQKQGAATKARRSKEEAFIESLPFRLSLDDREQAMRQGLVLPHERRRTATGEALPLTYQQEGGTGAGGYEDDDFEDEGEDDDYDEDEGIDDDLDL